MYNLYLFSSEILHLTNTKEFPMNLDAPFQCFYIFEESTYASFYF